MLDCSYPELPFWLGSRFQAIARCGGLSQQELRLSVRPPFFVFLRTPIHPGLSMREHLVDEPCQMGRHRLGRFARAEMGTELAIPRTQVAVTVRQCGGGAERRT